MDFETKLLERRAGIVAEIEGLRARVVALGSVLSSFDAVIGYRNPNAVPVCQVEVRPSSGVAIPAELQGIDKTTAVFEILREADRPLSSAGCVAALVARHGVPAYLFRVAQAFGFKDIRDTNPLWELVKKLQTVASSQADEGPGIDDHQIDRNATFPQAARVPEGLGYPP